MRCKLCPRFCNVNRENEVGFCGAYRLPSVAKTMLHFFEEPPISGRNGSGAVFFSGCNLGCVFCQNEPLKDAVLGSVADAYALKELYLSLQDKGAHNINLVTPTPHIGVIRKSLLLAKNDGLTIPVVYNTGSYERADVIRSLEGLIDIYLPDIKYVSPVLSKRFSNAEDYFEFAAPAIREMFRQVGLLTLDADGIAERGIILRHLVLPCCLNDSRAVLDYIADSFPKDITISLMRQYTPTERTTIPPLNRRLTDREYERILLYAMDLGFPNILMQGKSSASLSFTPDFTES